MKIAYIKIPHGIEWVVGVDEAGRGPLAGPVSLAAVAVRVKDRYLLEKEPVRDSKQLSPIVREEKLKYIKKLKKDELLQYTVSLVGERIIDREGIVSAVRRGIRNALSRLSIEVETTLVLLDGGIRAPKKYKHQQTIVKGDARVPIIAYASIAAKVRRDRKMKKYSLVFPHYGFEIHKGYGTALHIGNIKKHGPSIIHRKSFLNNFLVRRQVL